jgi:O-antigen/teichoic acid export membrane protein
MSSASTGQAPPPKPNASLRERVLKAGGWSVVAHVLSNVIRLGSSLVMTRLLAPELFGVMAIATVVQVIVAMLTDVGLSQAVIHSPRGNERAFLNTAWTMQVVRGMLIWLACLCVATSLFVACNHGWLPEGSVYAVDVLPAVIAVASLAAVISGLQSSKLITARRAIDLKRVTQIELTSQIVGLSAMVALGWLTRSIWAFVAGGLVSAAVATILSHAWLDGVRNQFAWDKLVVKEILVYGRWIFFSSLFGVLSMNADRLLLGIWASPAFLGFYAIGLNLATVVEGLGYRLFSSVSMPAFSDAARNNSPKFREIYYRMRLPVDLAYVGIAGFIFALAPSLIALLYDERYQPAGEILQWLSFGLIFSRYSLAHSAYMALGKPKYLTIITGVKLVSVLTLVPLLHHFHGLSGALVGVAFHLAPTLPFVAWFNHKLQLNDFRFEVLSLTMWPVGYIAGILLRGM